VTLPRDTGATIEVNDTREDLFTVDLRNLKPALTRTAVRVTDSPPAVVRVERYNVRSFPFGTPRMVHEVVVVVHECRPSRVDNTYVGFTDPEIAPHRNVTRPIPVDVRTTVGTFGAPLGAATPEVLDAPTEFSPVTVTLYV
jgi:hypothetical protein